ncbi:uncharacterized protein L969DRAFT_19558 [Mixia osmundae IAM 14324]|uniref:FCP1 homology domain-containing protein n=1 Tax=Mixia osmundae (strain CBS 9802 / IAM 14324 / JCM 22182 / KY 12970) TaxID=764103 RepID=G7EAW0_MIXOS|nr:uncharacterized protein L969DRAFT_19558 [Mixia osmundae IAM 14324]KEI37004.1 hypothetical protein L969DRAFT_19558 [Mixia osmundae IAM 14324]GAA99970.1 hypothetical protein E5Q_06673 [Mixia osmundae IAM 14324]
MNSLNYLSNLWSPPQARAGDTTVPSSATSSAVSSGASTPTRDRPREGPAKPAAPSSSHGPERYPIVYPEASTSRLPDDGHGVQHDAAPGPENEESINASLAALAATQQASLDRRDGQRRHDAGHIPPLLIRSRSSNRSIRRRSLRRRRSARDAPSRSGSSTPTDAAAHVTRTLPVRIGVALYMLFRRLLGLLGIRTTRRKLASLHTVDVVDLDARRQEKHTIPAQAEEVITEPPPPSYDVAIGRAQVSLVSRYMPFSFPKPRDRSSETSHDSEQPAQHHVLYSWNYLPTLGRRRRSPSTVSSLSSASGAVHEVDDDDSDERVSKVAPAESQQPMPSRLKSTALTVLARPKTLVLDLDETLIHSTSRLPLGQSTAGWGGNNGLKVRVVEVVLDGKSVVYHVYKRPWVDFFLRKVSTWYTVVIFTASMQEYADPVIDWLDQGRGLIDGRLFRESCMYTGGSYVKDLSIVDADLAKVCLVDNSPISYAKNPSNGIPIEGWINDPSDEALLDLLPMLDSLRFSNDVRRILGLRGFSVK